jgi:hypothetical protein
MKSYEIYINHMKIPWKITCSAQKSGYVQDASGLGAEEVIGS